MAVIVIVGEVEKKAPYHFIAAPKELRLANSFLNGLDGAEEIETLVTTERLSSDHFNGSQLKIVQMNIRSLRKNFDQFLVLLDGFSFAPDVIILTETWHCGSPTDGSTYSIPGYEAHFNAFQLNQNDGVVIFARASLGAGVSNAGIPGCNSLVLTFLHSNVKHIITGIYRPPSQLESTFVTGLSDYLSTLEPNNQTISTICGDININILSADPTPETSDYLNTLSAAGYYSAINIATRLNESLNSGSCLDHFFTTDHQNTTGHILTTSITDHFLVALTLNHAPLTSRVPAKNKEYLAINYQLLQGALAGEMWHDTLASQDADSCANSFLDTLSKHITDCTETKRRTCKTEKLKPWMTNGLLTSIRRRDKLRLKSRTNPTLRQTYTAYRNYLDRLITITKNNYYRTEFLHCNGDAGKTWKLIDDVTDTKRTHSTILKVVDPDTGCEVTRDDPQGMANAFNKFFAGIGESLASRIPYAATTSTTDNSANPHSLFLTPTDETEVDKYITLLTTNSSPGPDGIKAKIIKQFRQHLLQPLTYLINLCFTTASFPSVFKDATVIPIYKGKGHKHDITNYRPISLTSNIGKIIERAIKTRMTDFFDRSDYLADNQYGFRQGRSTQDAITKLTDLLYNDIENQTFPLTVFIDLAKAFDSISHPLLTKRLERAGIRGHSLDLLTSYLSGRRQVVRLRQQDNHNSSSQENIIFSSPADVTFGIPQGTVLGPLLFLCYINEFLRMDLGCTMLGFADDTVLHFQGNSWTDSHDKASKAITAAKRWFDDNKLTLNIDKTFYITFSPNNYGQPDNHLHVTLHSPDCPTTNCDCKKLTKTYDQSYLGLTFDQHLRWDRHIQITTTRIRKTLYKFKRLRDLVDIHTLRQIYYAIVQSIVQYALVAWGGAYASHLEKIERAMRCVLRVAMHRPYRHPSRTLFTDMAVPTLDHLYAKQLLLYRHANNRLTDYVAHAYGTRHRLGHSLRRPICRTSLFRNSHIYRSSSIFNLLQLELKRLPKNKFKQKIIPFIKNNYSRIHKILRPLTRSE